MKKYFVLTTLLTILILSHAISQKQIGIKGGISIPNLTDGGSFQNPINSGYSSRLGPDFSIFYSTGISKTFSLITQLEYSSQGGKKDGFQAIPTSSIQGIDQYFTAQSRPVPDFVYATYNSEAKMNYVLLSELAKFNLSFGAKSPLSFYAEVGPFAGLLVSAHQVTSGNSDIYADKDQQENITQNTQQGPQSFDNTENIKDDLHKGNFGIEGDLGFALNFTNSSIFIEGGGNYGFINIQKGTENGKNHVGAATVRIGYAFNIAKVKSHS